MRRLLLILVGIAGLAVLLTPAIGSAQTPSGTPTGGPTVARGFALYEQYCAACHGVNAQGTVNGPSLTDVGGAADVDLMLRTGEMPAPNPAVKPEPRSGPILSPTQIQAIDAWAASTLPGYAVPTVNPQAGNVSQGRKIFAQNCAACHGIDGAGGAIGGGYTAPSLVGVPPLNVAEAVRTGPSRMPVLYPTPVSKSNLNSVARYVATFKNASQPGGLALGGKGPVAEGWVAWGIGMAALILIVRWMGGRA